jgi:hypothetical protein
MDIRYIHLIYLKDIFCDKLVNISPFWYIASRKIWQTLIRTTCQTIHSFPFTFFSHYQHYFRDKVFPKQRRAVMPLTARKCKWPSNAFVFFVYICTYVCYAPSCSFINVSIVMTGINFFCPLYICIII